jgi:hypothetical protein
MARPQFEVGGHDLQVWRIAANILNKQSWATENEFGVGHGANNFSP